MALEKSTLHTFVDETTWELFNLLHRVSKQDGQVVVMELDKDTARVKAPSVLLDFAQDLCHTPDMRAKVEMTEEENEVQPHLVFMLLNATMLKQLMQRNHLDKVLRDVRNLLPHLPVVLVIVAIHKHPQEQLDETVEALRRMQCLLHGALPLVVETAVYSPGQPDGALDAKAAACRALREVLNFHEEVDPRGSFTISFPEFSYCCSLPEHVPHEVSETPGE